MNLNTPKAKMCIGTWILVILCFVISVSYFFVSQDTYEVILLIAFFTSLIWFWSFVIGGIELLFSIKKYYNIWAILFLSLWSIYFGCIYYMTWGYSNIITGNYDPKLSQLMVYIVSTILLFFYSVWLIFNRKNPMKYSATFQRRGFSSVERGDGQ